VRIELGHDHWAELRDADQIPRKQARKFRKVLYKVAAPAADVDQTLDDDAKAIAAGKALMASADGLDGIEEMAEAMVLAVVSEWSFGEVTPEVLDTLPDAAVNAIYERCQKDGYVEKLMPDFSPSPDLDSPTKPSTA
jgi:hypothetical protein